MENKKITPMKFLPKVEEMPWGSVEYKLADLGFEDSLCCEGWLSGNTISEIMETYLERIVGETSFEWYGTQFPVLVKRLKVKGRTSLHINPDDETAAQRYDAFGKTALWYVESCGPDARIYLGFKRPVGAGEFFEACEAGTVESLLHSVKPKPGDVFLVEPGTVHAAQDVTLLEIAESSELWFRLHEWEDTGRELHLEEGFDLIDLQAYARPSALPGGLLAAKDQFTVGKIALEAPLHSTPGIEETFLIYICVNGAAAVVADGKRYGIPAGDLVLVPAELGEFDLVPDAPGTVVLEVRMDPRASDDITPEADGSEN